MATYHVVVQKLRSGNFKVVSDDGERDFGTVNSVRDVEQHVRKVLGDPDVMVIQVLHTL